jgi:beta-lactamase superfamily II metal-dependent hydrolase
MAAAKTLDIYFIDVDHGNAVLLVTPAGESLMFDTGQAGDKYVDRIMKVIRLAGLKQLDYVVVSHYDWDHYATVPALSEKIPIRNFVDHGQNIREVLPPELLERDNGGGLNDPIFRAYVKAREKGNHIVAKPGDTLPVKGVEVRIATSAGNVLLNPLPGAGRPNPACAKTEVRTDDVTEDGQSVSEIVTYGKFRFADFGDLTWNNSYRLFCPNNPIGTVDAYVITHHGISQDLKAEGVWDWGRSSNPPAEVGGLRPRVAFLTAGEDFVGRVGNWESWERTRKSPGLEDIWQVHYCGQAGPPGNAPDNFIANPTVLHGQGHYIKLSANPDGSFAVTNTRNGFTKQYPVRKEVK